MGESENTINLKTPTPHNQPMEGRKRVKRRQKRKSRLGQQEGIGSAFKTLQSHTIKKRSLKFFHKDTERGTKVLCVLQ